MDLDADLCYRAVKGRDRRFDGLFYTAVRTTGIYCRPSCPAITPQRRNVSFFPSAAAAQIAGFRACRRCLPDATPGSPAWDVAADAAGRAMRLVADGVVERDGVDGLARRLGYSTRQLNRLVTSAYGAGPLALSRSRRAQTARVLVETSGMSFADVAFASGFASIRQFNDTIREVYAATPSQLRGRRGGPVSSGTINTRIAVREPFSGSDLLAFLAARAVPGVEAAGSGWYERSLRLPHGSGVLRLEPESGGRSVVAGTFTLADARDLAPAMERTRRLLDADCDPVPVAAALAEDPVLRPLVARRPGLRVPGHVDGAEVAVRAVLGQQVSVAAARRLAARLVTSYGEPLDLAGEHRVTRLFPDPAVLGGLDQASLAMPRSRAKALLALCQALTLGDVVLDRSGDRTQVRRALLAIPGIGPWTADYIALRALGDPDVILATDLGLRQAAVRLGIDDLRTASAAWRPWRSYAQLQLWASLADGNPHNGKDLT
ncbi:MAG: helix-turn-helix domain-containing protein [Actinomycetota bacterium]|nr:helix-turn-helix domain-containing protein [Actinomycetota bacterium]